MTSDTVTHTYLCAAWFHGNLDPEVRRLLAIYGWTFTPAHIVDVDYDGESLQRTSATIRVNTFSAAVAESASRNNLRLQDSRRCRVADLRVTQVGP
jgi:hypothetical protein